jgi:hypothetical protein
MEKMPHPQLEPLEQAQNSHRRGWLHRVIRLTLAAGPLRVKATNQPPFVLGGRSGYQRRSTWGLVQLESATGSMEKMSHLSDGQIWHRTAERPGCILLPAVSGTHRAISTCTLRVLARVAPLRRQPIRNVCPHFWRVIWAENASSGCRTTRSMWIAMLRCCEAA